LGVNTFHSSGVSDHEGRPERASGGAKVLDGNGVRDGTGRKHGGWTYQKGDGKQAQVI